MGADVAGVGDAVGKSEGDDAGAALGAAVWVAVGLSSGAGTETGVDSNACRVGVAGRSVLVLPVPHAEMNSTITAKQTKLQRLNVMQS